MNTIVLDNGTGIIKAGFAGENFPRVIIPNIVGYPKFDNKKKKIYVCDDAIFNKEILKLEYPLEHGIVKNWDALEKVWEKTFDELCVTTSNNKILLTEAPFNPKRNKEKMAEILFEKFNVPAVYVAIQAVLSLYASGRITGIVIDSGDGVTHTVPIYEGFMVKHCNLRTNLAGRQITNYMSRLLMENGIHLTNSSEIEIIRQIKEQFGYLSLDYKKELKNNFDTKQFTLPDGQIIALGQELFKCPEVLFNPMLIGKELPGMHELVKTTIDNCDITIRKDLYRNIILSGGTTSFKNFQERLNIDLQYITNPNVKINIISLLQQKYLVWIGGSILASIDAFSDHYITRKDWDEYGCSIIHRNSM